MVRLLIFSIFLLATLVASKSVPECRDGETTSMDNGCNNCFCSKGLWACTLKLCTDITIPNEPAKREVAPWEAPCKDGDTRSFDNGCNSCVCGNGNWACTMAFCFDSDVKIKRNVRECNLGEHKMEDCNKCFCTSTGIWACTKIGCNRKREAVAAGFQAR